MNNLSTISGMSEISAPKRLAMASAVKHLKDCKNLTISMLRGDRFLADSDWDLVDASTEIEDPYHMEADGGEVSNNSIVCRTPFHRILVKTSI